MASTGAAKPAPRVLTRAEREEMLFSVGRLLKSEVQRSKIPMRHREDVEQELHLALWKVIDNFDPLRGVKWSTFACAVLKRALANWKVRNNCEDVGKVVCVGSARAFDETIDRNAWTFDRDESDQDEEGIGDEGASLLSSAIRQKLAAGILDRLGRGHRRLVEMVAFEGLTGEQIAEQLGFPLKAVRANLKNAVRKLCGLGLASHAVSDQEVRSATAAARPLTPEAQQRASVNGSKRHFEDSKIVAELVRALQPVGANDALDAFGAEVKAVVLEVAAKRIQVSQAGTRLKLMGARTRDLFRTVLAALNASVGASDADTLGVRPNDRDRLNAEMMSDLDAVVGNESFRVELDKLDDDTRVVVLALIDRSFTPDEAVELLGGDREAVLNRVRGVTKAVRDRGPNVAQVDTGEMIAR